ncbi:uncharacterized protein EV154DRAFT_428217 [Mucor mucedo]|uniref:uncharacterized protein n=1 Tax=Mucor mucedo TaxID=29922 RepID=UPI00221F0AF8|nr:uncharacterized protein EV154DRAFT_428217 [Mucor mucedo]KAI7883397.1 hypothetical protein EV154DRAFT_428217 [Mucor mucedo]
MSSPPPQHSLSSPTSGNTPHPVLPTPSSSTSVSIRQNNKTSQLRQRQELEQQLVEKQKQLQETSSGIGKNVLARQVSQLQDRIKEIDSVINNPTSNDEIQPVSVDRLRSLERDLSSYRSHPLSPGISSIRNKEKLLNQRTTSGLDPLPSPSTSTLLPPTHGHDSTSLLPLPPPPTGSTPTKRRSKIPNTDRRNTDIEFATEIGQGLLLEVRKMQALLQEKEEKLRTLENQKADLERAAEAMAKQMRQREENEEKLKEETWNLELAKQELTISVTELQQNLSKANVEQNKLDKQVNVLRSEIEKLRDKEEKLTNTIDTMKQRHEQDMSSIRRHAAAIQREKSDQSKQIEALTSELAIAKAQSRIGKHVSTDTEVNPRSGDTTDDQTTNTLAVNNETSPTSSPPSSPKLAPARNQAMEVETLKTSLAHAHRMVSNLRSNLHKEKTEKFEFKKLLADSQETIEQLQNDPRMWVDAGPTRGASGSSSNIVTREDGLGPARRPHKASLSSSTKRRGSRKPTSGRIKPKGSSPNATADGDSIYSYSSMSELDDSEEVDSFDDSDAGFDNTVSKKKTVGFTPLSSELSRSQSQNQLQKPVMVDAEVNTDPMDDSMLPLNTLGDSTADPVTRSLGDELDAAVGLIAGVGAAVGVDALMKPTGIEIYTQTDVYEEPKAIPGIEMITQTDPEPEAQVNEVFTQTDSSKLEQLSLATITSTQFEEEDPSIAAAAAEAAAVSTALATATAIAASRLASLEAAVDSCTQSEGPSVIDQETQFEETRVVDIGVQSTPAVAVDAFIQSEFVETKDSVVQYESSAKDVSVQHQHTTVECGVQSDSPVTADASAQHDFVNAIDANVQYEVESTDIGVQCEEENTASGIGAILPIPPIASHTFSDSEDEFFDANSKPSSRRTIDSAVFNNLKPESRNSNLSESHLIPVVLPHTQNELGSDRSDDNQKTELGNVAPAEKMYSKAETDSLIATAVALALKNAESLKSSQNNQDDVLDNTKHHAHGLNSKNEDPAIVTPTSDISRTSRNDDDDEQPGDENFGNVLVHSPREEDTITFLPYDEAAQQRPELTIGPSIVFAQEPEEPEEREITAADVPQRPANPPPHELLNKAGLSSTFTDSRSMSPSSLHSKGKGSVDASSVSTSNTNEQLRSLNSSQYDAVTRSTGATDPTMINLITQTMIGDWLYKYTRKAVGGGFSEKSHKRYFWIHPYTRTLYWSVSAPGLNGNESKAKSGKYFFVCEVTHEFNVFFK